MANAKQAAGDVAKLGKEVQSAAMEAGKELTAAQALAAIAPAGISAGNQAFKAAKKTAADLVSAESALNQVEASIRLRGPTAPRCAEREEESLRSRTR